MQGAWALDDGVVIPYPRLGGSRGMVVDGVALSGGVPFVGGSRMVGVQPPYRAREFGILVLVIRGCWGRFALPLWLAGLHNLSVFACVECLWGER